MRTNLHHRDQQDFTSLYEANFDKIKRFIRLKTGSDEVAADLAQQTFLNAWKSLADFKRTKVAVSAWLYRIAHNLIIDYYRKEGRLVALTEELATPVEFVEQQLKADELSRELAHLTEQEQQVVELRFVEGLSLEEVAAVMKKTKGAVSTIQYRAFKRLQAKRHSQGIG